MHPTIYICESASAAYDERQTVWLWEIVRTNSKKGAARPALTDMVNASKMLSTGQQVSVPGYFVAPFVSEASRYVHGGFSLQEIVLPVVEVKKERTSDIGRVEVDIVRSGQQITTGQVTITFLQSEPAGEKSLPRELRAGFFSKTGVPISDAKVLKFDSTAEDARQRERGEQFVFGREADKFNQQEVGKAFRSPQRKRTYQVHHQGKGAAQDH